MLRNRPHARTMRCSAVDTNIFHSFPDISGTWRYAPLRGECMTSRTVRDFSAATRSPCPNRLVCSRRPTSGLSKPTRPTTSATRMIGLESLMHEVFPIESYDGSMRLEYLYYKLDKSALHAGRVQGTPPDLRHAVPHRRAPRSRRRLGDSRGRDLPRRDSRSCSAAASSSSTVRTRDRQPVAPLAGCRLQRSRQPR